MKNILIIFFFFLFANFPILLNSGIFWDDWTLYNMSTEGIQEQFVGNGGWNAGIGYLHIFLQEIPHPSIAYHIITFFLYFSVILIFYKTLSFFNIDPKTRLTISIIAATVPFNQAKITMICLPYGISIFCFSIGFLLLTKYLKERKIITRILSIVFFLYSFTTNSLLVFYAVTPLSILYFYNANSIQKAKGLAINFIDFFLIPIIFWVIRSYYMSPKLIYAEGRYNEFSLKNLLLLPIRLINSLFDVFIGGFSVINHITFPYYFIPIFFLIYLYKIKLFNKNIFQLAVTNYKIIMSGLILFILGATPYILVGKTPLFYGYNSRHQLLILFSYSLIVVGVINKIVKPEHKTLLICIIISTNISISLYIQQKFMLNWIKQENIVFELRSNKEELNKHKTIIIIDQTKELNPTEEPMHFYEWNGLAKVAFNTQNHLFIDNDLSLELKNKSLATFAAERKRRKAAISRNMKDYSPDGTCATLFIKPIENLGQSWTKQLKVIFKWLVTRENPKVLSIKIENGCNELN